MSTPLPAVPSLEQLKKQAKDLRKAASSGDDDALARIRAVPETKVSAAKPTLAGTQLVLAREHGFESWPKLKRHVESARLEATDLTAALFEATLCTSPSNNFPNDLARASELLAANPELARASLHAACAFGEEAAAERFLAKDPSLANKKGGPKQREPLLYLSFSRFLKHDAKRARAMLKLARRLLDLGADANAFYLSENPGYTDEKQAALYGAAGISDNAELTRMLLKAGADPNDHESLYHASESSDLGCLRLILEAKPKPEWVSYCLAHKLDFEDYAGVKLYLDHGADPNHVTPFGDRWTRLHHAIERGRGVKIVELLLDRGASLAIRDAHGQTPYTLAVRLGRTDVAALLRKRGASDADLTETERFLGACGACDTAAARAILARNPKLLGQLGELDRASFVDAAQHGRTDVVRTMLDVGFQPGWTNARGQTALHTACFSGHADVVKLLLQHKPPLEVRDKEYKGTPLNWAIAGTEKLQWSNPNGQYPAVVEALLAAGAKPPEHPPKRADIQAVLQRFAERKKK